MVFRVAKGFVSISCGEIARLTSIVLIICAKRYSGFASHFPGVVIS